MTYNEQLYNLYEQHWKSLASSVRKLPDIEKPTNPLLLQLPDEKEYRGAGIKMMFVGQETNDWKKAFGYYSIASLQEVYRNFLMNYSSRTSPFWRFINSSIHSMQEANPQTSISMVWNNIYKLGCIKKPGAPPKSVREIISSDFNVFEKELTILQPNVVVFLTGPRYNKVLRKYLPGIEFHQVAGNAERQIAWCSHPALPTTSIRTYHPGYLNRLKPGKHEFHREIPKEVLLHQWARTLH